MWAQKSFHSVAVITLDFDYAPLYSYPTTRVRISLEACKITLLLLLIRHHVLVNGPLPPCTQYRGAGGKKTIKFFTITKN